MKHPSAWLFRGSLMAAVAAAATGFVVEAPHAADARPPQGACERWAPAPTTAATPPQAPFDETPITPRESVAASDRE